MSPLVLYVRPPTFSSLVATLKASSVTLPAAQRAALEECSSFQMVSLSTCKKGDTQTGTGTGIGALTDDASAGEPTLSASHPARGRG